MKRDNVLRFPDQVRVRTKLEARKPSQKRPAPVVQTRKAA